MTTGLIGIYAGKLAAERAAKRVRGVRAVANGVEVRLRLPRTDPEIAAEKALRHIPGVVGTVNRITVVDNQLTVAPLVPGPGAGDDAAC